MLKIIRLKDARALQALLAHDAARDPRIVRAAARIVRAVRDEGDEALLRFARRYDGSTGPLEVARDEMEHAAARVPAATRNAIRTAVRHVARVAVRQVPASFSVSPTRGVRITQRVTPLARVGCYVPAGRYPLLSSLVMSAVPARAAGVREIIAVCPKPDDGVLAAAVEAGVTRLFRVGGAHAIAALAYGTASVPAVDRITGPGNAYVAAAKDLIAERCAIDFHAGPSEIVVLSDTGRPDWIAADLVAQAEHDPDARAILITTSAALARRVSRAVARALASLAASAPSSAATARTALASRGAAIVTRTRDEAIALANRIAPEHLVCDDARIAARVVSAGTIFVGRWSAQAAGDYATGSNHILPTGGAARTRGGLSAADFVKITAVQTLTRQGLRTVGPAAATLADAEGLAAHAASIRTRFEGTRR